MEWMVIFFFLRKLIYKKIYKKGFLMKPTTEEKFNSYINDMVAIVIFNHALSKRS